MSLIGVSQDFKIRNREIKYLSLHSGSFLKNLRNLKYKNPKYKELSVVNGGFFFFFLNISSHFLQTQGLQTSLKNNELKFSCN